MNVAVSPGFAGFRAAYESGRGTLVWQRDDMAVIRVSR